MHALIAFTSPQKSRTTAFIKPFMFTFLLVSATFSNSSMADASSSLSLTIEQQNSMGLSTQMAVKVAQFPSASFPAEAMIPLKTIRTLSSPLSGRISALNVVHGAIKKGENLAEIESAELLGLQTELLTTLADLNVARIELRRAQQLNKSGATSSKSLQQAQALVNKLSAQSSQQQQELLMVGMQEASVKTLLSTQSLQPAIVQITSPIEGQLYDLQIRLGERVSQNQPLFSLGETHPIVLVVRVPMRVAEQLMEGQMAMVPALKQSGVIEHIEPQVDAMTQSVDVHVQMDNAQHKIRPGQLFELHFLMTANDQQQTQQLYQTSSSAITQFEGESAVFIEVDKRIQALPIKVENITQQSLYFTVPGPVVGPLPVFIKGSTAIKSAFEAVESNEDQG